MLSDALTKAETGKKDDTSQDEVNKMVLSMAKVCDPSAKIVNHLMI